MEKFLALFLVLFQLSFAETIFTYMAKEDKDDPRKEYNNALLKLALDKTLTTYGPYKLIPSEPMNHTRARKIALKGILPNFIFKTSVTRDVLEELAHIPFPIDRGIVGYRVFFVSPEAKKRLERVSTLEELKQFGILQGIGWLDTDILRHHGFVVFEGGSYKGLFGMIAKNRVDLFPRGANELLHEYNAYQHIKNLTYDTSIVLYYPLPRFFFTNKKNTKAIERVHQGILLAYEDGSLIDLWNHYYKESIDFVDLKNRKIFKLENPFLEGIDTSYIKYIYTP